MTGIATIHVDTHVDTHTQIQGTHTPIYNDRDVTDPANALKRIYRHATGLATIHAGTHTNTKTRRNTTAHHDMRRSNYNQHDVTDPANALKIMHAT